MLRPHARLALRAIPLALLSLSASAAFSAEDKALRETVVTANRHTTDIDQISATVTSIRRDEVGCKKWTPSVSLFLQEASNGKNTEGSLYAGIQS